ncbi:hypothetical protein V8E53_008573 [Lactarius tabidus]
MKLATVTKPHLATGQSGRRRELLCPATMCTEVLQTRTESLIRISGCVHTFTTDTPATFVYAPDGATSTETGREPGSLAAMNKREMEMVARGFPEVTGRGSQYTGNRKADSEGRLYWPKKVVPGTRCRDAKRHEWVLVWELRLNHKFIPKVAEFVLEFRCYFTYVQLVGGYRNVGIQVTCELSEITEFDAVVLFAVKEVLWPIQPPLDNARPTPVRVVIFKAVDSNRDYTPCKQTGIQVLIVGVLISKENKVDGLEYGRICEHSRRAWWKER